MESAGKKDTEGQVTSSRAGSKERTLIFACSGLSNTGKLTMQAAKTLAFRRPGLYRAAAAPKGVEAAEDAVAEGFRLLVLNGCSDHCATKKLEESGIKAECSLMVTELGIEKTRPDDVRPGDIEKIVRAIKGL